MTIKTTGKPIKQKLRELQKVPLDKMLKQIKSDLVDESVLQGWNRFRKGIIIKKDSDTKGRVFVGDDVTASISKSGLSAGNNISAATNKEIGGYLHFGRGEVSPVFAKALRFYIGGKVIFSKVSKAVKAVPWWGLIETTKIKVRKILRDYIKNGR